MHRHINITHLNESSMIPYLKNLNIQLHEVTDLWSFIAGYFTWTVVVPTVVIFNFVLDNFYSLVVPQLLMLPADLVLFYFNYQAFSGQWILQDKWNRIVEYDLLDNMDSQILLIAGAVYVALAGVYTIGIQGWRLFAHDGGDARKNLPFRDILDVN